MSCKTRHRPFIEGELSRWRLIEDFQARLTRAASQVKLHPTWSDPERRLQFGDYLSLFLFGLLNPVVKTTRGLCAASHLQRVQKQICSRPVSLGSFSAAQHVVNPDLLAQVFSQLSQEVMGRSAPDGLAARRWLVQDSSLFDALPRMYWALWRRQGRAQAQVRLHLSLDLSTGSPARATVTPSKTCERAAWRTQWQQGDAYVGDRYYGEDYQLLGQMEEAGVAFVVRLRDEAVLQIQEELPRSPADHQVKVLRAAWVQLGCKPRYHSRRLRVVWVQTPREVLRLVTNLGPEELTAGQVALLYKERWQIELFFRWVKSILGCRHWLAESPCGTALELYLALIAALLLQLYTGVRPNQRMMEMIRWSLVGLASVEELCAAVQAERARALRKKS